MIRFPADNTVRIVIAITIIAIFFYLFRLEDTQLFINDTSRDTLRALRIWQERETTLIGASASFSEHTIKEIYFGSLYLYTAIVGMFFSGFSPLGAVYPNTILYALSIPIFYLLAQRYSKNNFFRIFSTLLYALSPITITHARFFWNPNLLIPLSVFFWYLALSPVNSKHLSLKLISSGILAGLMFNFHYFSIIPIALFCLYLLFSKKLNHLLYIAVGFILGSLPLILFELKNNFYLSNAFIYNLSHGVKGISHTPSFYLDGFYRIFLSVFGLSHGEIPFPVFPLTQIIRTLIKIFLSFLIVRYFIKRRRHSSSYWLWFCLLPTIVFTLYFSTADLYLRYLFAAYPLLILFIADLISDLKKPYLFYILFIPIYYSNISVISANVSLKNSYLPLKTIEAISDQIVSDNPSGNYNITENLKGDARSTAIRFFLLRDAKVKPQSEIFYDNLNTLYVVSPSMELAYKEGRWELAASGPKNLIKTTDFGDVKLFRLERSQGK